MIESLGAALGGLGLFFAGVRLLTDNLKRLAGRRLRRAIINWTKRPLLAFGWGTLIGSVSQSVPVVVFVLVGMLSAGMMTVKAALPIIVGANIGASMLVFLTTLDIKLIMLFAIGVTGIALNSDYLTNWQPLIGALFGLGLLMLGISILQEGAVPLVQQPWAADLLESARDSYMIIFFVAAGLTILAQTATTIGILAIAFAGAGVFTMEQTLMAIYGANFGGSVNTQILTWGLRGRPRQIGQIQVIFNVAGCLVLVPLFYLEILLDLPLVLKLVSLLPGGLEQHMAYAFLLFNSVAAIVVLALASVIERVGASMFPPTAAEDDSRLKFLGEHAQHDPESALELVRLEQSRLLVMYRHYFEHLRGEAPKSRASIQHIRQSFSTLAHGIDEFLAELAQKSHDPDLYDVLNERLRSQHLLAEIGEVLFDLAQSVEQGGSQPGLGRFHQNVIEALDTVVMTLHGAVVDGNANDQRRLDKMAGDRSQTMQRIRRAYLATEAGLLPDAKLGLLQITNLCERFFSLVGEFGRSQRASGT